MTTVLLSALVLGLLCQIITRVARREPMPQTSRALEHKNKNRSATIGFVRVDCCTVAQLGHFYIWAGFITSCPWIWHCGSNHFRAHPMPIIDCRRRWVFRQRMLIDLRFQRARYRLGTYPCQCLSGRDVFVSLCLSQAQRQLMETGRWWFAAITQAYGKGRIERGRQRLVVADRVSGVLSSPSPQDKHLKRMGYAA